MLNVNYLVRITSFKQIQKNFWIYILRMTWVQTLLTYSFFEKKQSLEYGLYNTVTMCMADFLALNTKYRKKTRRRSDEESPTTLTLSVRSTPQTDFSSWSLWIALYWCKISILFDNSSSYHLHLKIKPKILMHCIYLTLHNLKFYLAYN